MDIMPKQNYEVRQLEVTIKEQIIWESLGLRVTFENRHYIEIYEIELYMWTIF
jgi:hypothetical protein